MAMVGGIRQAVGKKCPSRTELARVGRDVQLARWIRSNTLLRTDDDLKREMRTELGFSRNGVRIDAALTRAVATVRRSG